MTENMHHSTHNNGSDNHHASGNLQTSAKDFAKAAADAYQSADTFLTKQANEQPYVLLGVAAGVGFLLAGGLVSRFTADALGIAGRIAASQVLQAVQTNSRL
jgi:ElaB/YqjD/DUF883 family membrane-anchored ribosome-binding protein